jgi:hypothetical protein
MIGMQTLWNRLLLLRPLFRAGWVNHAARQHPSRISNCARMLQSVWWHKRQTVPALLKSTLHKFTADAVPLPLSYVLQVVDKFPGPFFLTWIDDPYLRRTLVWWQFASRTTKVLPLNIGIYALKNQGISPQPCNH